ncbi:MAG: DNA gyrase subunit A [Gammaproteobacteria bacterium]|nr:DNA gyrase subunit A [Gammaproteobacteria bacterium]
MAEFAKEVTPVNIEDEMQRSYLDYAMSVIVGRALPDVRDGLKPVHRRVLFAMQAMGNDHNKPYKKSARIVGDVIGKYHPHGDSAVYDTIVRMAQDFSLRYLLVDGQGNFGSVDGDSAAAMRYTEIRLSKIAHELMGDIDRETVDFVANYDGSEHEPAVLPTAFPNLLVNGSTGIAVGMATNIPPHNLNEVVDACVAMVDRPDISVDELLQIIPGPDFPTGAIINGASGIEEAYRTGRGKIYVRGRAEVERNDGQQKIIISELPYQVNKARLLEKIAELVKEKRLEGITEIRDESDKDGMRVVIELRRGEVGEVTLNNLYKTTQLENVFGINIVVLVDGQPKLCNLSELIEAFIRHRCEVVSRRSLFELRKAGERSHLLEGLAVALANIDPVIALIKACKTSEEARQELLARPWLAGSVQGMLERAGALQLESADAGLQADGYHLSARQAQAILDMRLHRLTGLEQDKILEEYEQLLVRMQELREILDSRERLMAVIREELVALKEQYGDARRSTIVQERLDLELEDLIAEEDMVVTLSRDGYVKAQPLSEYRSQRRGGRGRSAARVKDEDLVDQLLVASSHDTVLCFSSAGKAYWLKVYGLPQGGSQARGRPIVNLLSLADDEKISAMLPQRDLTGDRQVFFATALGTIKKTPLIDFSRPRTKGIIAVELSEGDQLVGVDITTGEDDIMLFSDAGKVIRFHEQQVRSMGRTARGVRGMRLGPDDRLISLVVVREGDLLTVTERGFGKRTPLADYAPINRGGQGVISIRTSERNGKVVGAVQVAEGDEVMLITNGGTLIRTPVAGISMMGRNTQGVTLMGLDSGEKLVMLERVKESDESADSVADEA